MSCKYLSKALNGNLRCKYKKQIITLQTCKNCSNFILVTNKPISKRSKNKITVKSETYNKVYKRDNGKCQLCGCIKNLHLHHINGRGKYLTNNVKNCILLCENCHLNIVHKNQKKYRPILLNIIEQME